MAVYTLWRASRVHISVALEMHEEHLFTAHHRLIGHTCGSSACRLLSSVLTETRREASPWDRNLTLSLSPVPDSSVWPTSTITSTARIHPHLDTIENTATSPNGITTHALEHRLIKSTLRGFWFELSLSRVPFHPVTTHTHTHTHIYTHIYCTYTYIYTHTHTYIYIYIYIYTLSHRSEYTFQILLNILSYLFTWQHRKNGTLLQCKVVSVQLV